MLNQNTWHKVEQLFNNLSKEELDSLQNLKKNQAIVIKMSDKNLGLTIMDFDWYDAECMRQLEDTIIYFQLCPTQIEQVKFTTKLTLQKLIEKYKHVLTKQECRLLQLNLVRPGQVYHASTSYPNCTKTQLWGDQL